MDILAFLILCIIIATPWFGAFWLHEETYKSENKFWKWVYSSDALSLCFYVLAIIVTEAIIIGTLFFLANTAN